jgi:PBP1b-binding outer membrane lipoprotein LpoB
MKKIFFLLAIILAFSVTSCKQANVESTEDMATDTTEVAVPSADTTSVDTTAVDTVK